MLARRTSAAQAFSFPLLGARAVPLVTAADTDGGWEALELVLGPGARSPLHALAADKLFSVTAGTVAVTLDADEALVEAGGFVHVPAGTPHCYRNTTDEQARMHVVTSGRDQVAFLQGMSALTADGPADPAAVAAHTAAHGVRILAPAGA